VFDPPSLNEFNDISGINNKYFCLIDLQQGYHYFPLQASERKKTSFSNAGRVGMLQYRDLPYGPQHNVLMF
jgi:hypothetical protein